MSLTVTDHGPVRVVTLARPAVRNAVDEATSIALFEAFTAFEHSDARVAVLTGAGGHFCAGADLKELASGGQRRLEPEGRAPMGCTRMALQKPVIAAIEGFAVAGGLELACWADLRVAAEDAVLGVFCRRFGVPLIDLGTVRLPRLIGQSRALDLVLTGRPVTAAEALSMGLVNRVVPTGTACEAAIALGEQIAAFPQRCLQNDRQSLLSQWSLTEEQASRAEFALGLDTLRSGETLDGAGRFADGEGRHGRFSED